MSDIIYSTANAIMSFTYSDIIDFLTNKIDQYNVDSNKRLLDALQRRRKRRLDNHIKGTSEHIRIVRF